MFHYPASFAATRRCLRKINGYGCQLLKINLTQNKYGVEVYVSCVSEICIRFCENIRPSVSHVL